MSLKATLDAALKTAMHAKDQLRLDTIRQVKSAIKYKEVELIRACEDADIVKILSTLAKQRREAIEQFTAGDRAELAAKEAAELKILEEFLPQQLSEIELRAMIAEAITTTGAQSPKELGLVMKALAPKTAGRADGTLVSRLVRELLGS